MSPLYPTGIDGLAVLAEEEEGYRVVSVDKDLVVPISDWLSCVPSLKNYLVPMIAGLLIGIGIAELLTQRDLDTTLGLWSKVSHFDVDTFIASLPLVFSVKALPNR